MSAPDWHVEGTMERAQYDALAHALKTNGYNLSRTSAQLRIGRSTAYRLVKRYGLDASKELRREARRQAPPNGIVQRRDAATVSAMASKVIFDGTNFMLVHNLAQSNDATA